MAQINKSIVFATGNARKITEASGVLSAYNLVVEPIKVATEEIQHSDPAEITKAKVRAAYDIIKKPVVVQDTSWSIPALGGFPGGYMKDVGIWWSEQDWIAVMAHHDDKRIICLEHIAYYDGQELKHFIQEYEGYFVSEARGRQDDDESFERVVVLTNGETMAEQLARGEDASASEASEHWHLFAKWFTRN